MNGVAPQLAALVRSLAALKQTFSANVKVVAFRHRKSVLLLKRTT
jgi:hypothetical protein